MKAVMLRALLLVSLTAPILPAVPQDDGTPRMTVKVRFEPKNAKPGDTVTLLIDGEVDPDYHVYGALEELGTIPNLEIGKAAAAVLETKGAFDVPPGELHVNQDLPDLKSFWIRGSVQFKQTFVVKKDALNGEFAFAGGLVYMACTEQFCDPPYTQKIAAKLTVTGGSDRKPSAILAKLPTKTQDKFSAEHIGAKQVMRIKLVPATARAGEVVTVEIHTSMSPGWHNYGSAQDPEGGEPVSMKVTQQDLEILGQAEIPPGEKEEIPLVGTYHHLVGDWVMRQKVRVPAGAKPGEIQVAVDLRYTACDENVCLDPVDTKVGAKLVIEAGPVRPEYAKGPDSATGPPKSNGAGGTAGKADPQGKNGKTFVEIEHNEFQGDEDPNELGLWLYLLGAVGAGLFALIMPCTYPMIPLTVSFFTKQAEVKGGRPIFLALAYGGGIVASYLVLGGFLGPFMQTLAANPWLNLVFGLAFVFFAMSLFGLVELKPPQFLMNSATRAQGMAASSKSGIGAVFPVFLMGVTLCITSFACTAPFLGSMLAAGASSGGQGRLLLGMGVFGVTMALPFVVLSLVPGRLPRGGAWMNSAKILFGFVELAAALKFFSNAEYAWDWLILPREVFLVIWAILFFIAGVYLLGLIKLKGETGEIGGGRLVTGSVVLVLAGYFALGANGHKFDNIVMTAFEPPYPETAAHTVVEDDFDKALEVASTAQKLLLVNFTGKT